MTNLKRMFRLSSFGVVIVARALLKRLSVSLLAAVLALFAPRSPAVEIDVRPLPLTVEVAFDGIEWTGWSSGIDEGTPTPLRPILVTHAGDGSGRVYVATQRGVIYQIDPERPEKAGVFLDLEARVAYDDKTNEEGLLGLAFHPHYSDNGELYVYYTNKNQPHQNVVARFRRGSDDPRRADEATEEILLVLDKPFWNHDGGTILFGPDGCLYVAVGDGGLANDPFENGQKLASLLGKILRIDVDRRMAERPYAIPDDNPFVDRDGARGEIWAYGLRNVWRMAFDRQTGLLWAADVGQDTWEEINLIEKGGNYGWNLREGMHPFAKSRHPSLPRPDLIEPIFEYHHDLGKSITGGMVYRGRQIPELQGAYLYADYVTGRMWALRYDQASRQVSENREIPLPRSIPVLSFGEDEEGEAYFTTHALDGRGVFRLAPPAEAARAAQPAAANARAAAADPIDPARATPDDDGSTLWYDLRLVTIEGQGFSPTQAPFDRLPAKAQGLVREAVWDLSRHSAGIAARLVTDATTLSARWTLTSDRLAMPHMPSTGVSGLDLYVRDGTGRWRWLACAAPDATTTTKRLVGPLPPGTREYLLYLPLYNGVVSVELGVPRGSLLAAAPPRSANAAKPLVLYGTSITHGACASRPGMTHAAILGRRFDRPVINLGFSGNGRMEPELAGLLAEIDAAVYVLDCLPNIGADEVSQRTPQCVAILREAHPETPIVLVEDRSYGDAFLVESKRQRNLTSRIALRKVFDELLAAGQRQLYYLEGDRLLGDDNEATVDSSHPTDLGFMRQADAMARILEPILHGPQ